MTIVGLKGLIEDFISNSSAPEGRYSGRSQTYYQDGYSDEEGASSRVPSGGGGSGAGSNANRSRPVSSSNRDHRRQPSYNQEPRRSLHKPSKLCNMLVYFMSSSSCVNRS